MNYGGVLTIVPFFLDPIQILASLLRNANSLAQVVRENDRQKRNHAGAYSRSGSYCFFALLLL